MKKLISLVLAFIMITSVVPHFSIVTNALNTEEVAVSSEQVEFDYEINEDNTLTITGCSNPPSTLVIPSDINGHTVTAIGERAFEGRFEIHQVILPDSVEIIKECAFSYCYSIKKIDFGQGIKTIEDSAFSSCFELTTITIPDSVLIIGINAFGGCYNAEQIELGSSVQVIGDLAFCSTKEINLNIPDSVEIIGNRAFDECYSLESVTIGNSVKNIGDRAFACNYELTDIIIPDSVESLGESIFYNCGVLKSISLGRGVKSIGENAFDICSSLERIDVDKNNPVYYSIDGVLYSREDDSLFVVPEKCNPETIIIPDGVTEVNLYQFSGCDNLNNITIGSAVETIDGLDSGHTSLENIHVSENNPYYFSVNGVLYSKKDNSLVKYPAKNKTEHLVIPDGITHINNLPNSDNILSITIPQSVVSIGTADSGKNLQNINVDKNNKNYCSVDGVLYNKEMTNLLCYPSASAITDYVLPETVESVTDNLSSTKYLKNIYLHKNVSYFKIDHQWGLVGECIENIFVDDDNPVYYDENGVVYSYEDESYLCIAQHSKVKSLKLPDRPQYMLPWWKAFVDLEELETVIVGENIDDVALAPVCNAVNIKNIIVDDNNPNYCDIDGVLYSKDKKTLLAYPRGRNADTYKIPDTVEKITFGAFFNDMDLTHITIPESVEYVEDWAFFNCHNLKDVTVSKNIKEFGVSIGHISWGNFYAGGSEGVIDGVAIRGYVGTPAESYALEYGFDFIDISKEALLGDVDLDGNVSVIDATAIQMSLALIIELDSEASKYADTDRDGCVSVMDATAIQMFLAQLIDKL